MVRAVFFDPNKVTPDTSSNMALPDPFIETDLMNRRAAFASVLVQLPYLPTGADESRMGRMTQALGCVERGWNTAFLETMVEDTLGRVIQPACHVQTLARIEQHKRAGDIIVIASASVKQMVHSTTQMLEAGGILASCAAVDEDGRLTGEITHFNQAQGKTNACEALAHVHGWSLSDYSAYSDPVSDAPFLHFVGHPYAVNPDRGLYEIA